MQDLGDGCGIHPRTHPGRARRALVGLHEITRLRWSLEGKSYGEVFHARSVYRIPLS